jgi:hypothetical protein
MCCPSGIGQSRRTAIWLACKCECTNTESWFTVVQIFTLLSHNFVISYQTIVGIQFVLWSLQVFYGRNLVHCHIILQFHTKHSFGFSLSCGCCVLWQKFIALSLNSAASCQSLGFSLFCGCCKCFINTVFLCLKKHEWLLEHRIQSLQQHSWNNPAFREK